MAAAVKPADSTKPDVSANTPAAGAAAAAGAGAGAAGAAGDAAAEADVAHHKANELEVAGLVVSATDTATGAHFLLLHAEPGPYHAPNGSRLPGPLSLFASPSTAYRPQAPGTYLAAAHQSAALTGAYGPLEALTSYEHLQRVIESGPPYCRVITPPKAVAKRLYWVHAGPLSRTARNALCYRFQKLRVLAHSDQGPAPSNAMYVQWIAAAELARAVRSAEPAKPEPAKSAKPDDTQKTPPPPPDVVVYGDAPIETTESPYAPGMAPAQHAAPHAFTLQPWQLPLLADILVRDRDSDNPAPAAHAAGAGAGAPAAAAAPAVAAAAAAAADADAASLPAMGGGTLFRRMCTRQPKDVGIRNLFEV